MNLTFPHFGPADIPANLSYLIIARVVLRDEHAAIADSGNCRPNA